MTERKRSRDIFEKLATERKWYQPLYGLTRSDFRTDEYLDLYLQHRWEGWQAMEEIMVNNINKALEPVQESLETPSRQCIEKIITPVECFTRLAELVAKTERSDNDEFDYASMMSHAYNFTDQYLHPAESSPKPPQRKVDSASITIAISPRTSDSRIWVARCLEMGFVTTGVGFNEALQQMNEVLRIEWAYVCARANPVPAESSPIDWRQFHVGCCNGNHSKPLGGPMCVCHPHKLNEIITQQQIRIRELEAESSPKPKCKYGDPGCPCQDGDECHYEGENPWPPPKPAESPRKLTWAEETMHMINELTPDIKGKAFDPDWFLLRQRLEEFERATPSPEPPSNPICGICNMPLSDHEKLTKRCPVGHWDFAETVFTKSGQDIVKEAFDALTPERTEEILNEVEAKFGPDRPSPEPPRQIADTLDDSLHEINIVGADPRNSIDHAISERTRRILAQQKPVPTIEEVVDALKSGDAFVVGHRDEKQDLSRQSPMYRDAAAILGEIGKSKLAHTQTLKLMNWKLEMAPSSHSEPELVKLRQIRLLARWDGPDAAPKRMHEIWEKLGAIIENLEMRAALASTKS